MKKVKTESELVHDYVNRVIGGKVARGHVDKRFNYTKKESTVNKELWLDTDFFFSVVFQSSEQKYQFIEAMKLEHETMAQIQIVNGLKLAEKFGIKLKRETAQDHPKIDLDLLPLVLDNETIP